MWNGAHQPFHNNRSTQASRVRLPRKRAIRTTGGVAVVSWTRIAGRTAERCSLLRVVPNHSWVTVPYCFYRPTVFTCHAPLYPCAQGGWQGALPLSAFDSEEVQTTSRSRSDLEKNLHLSRRPPLFSAYPLPHHPPPCPPLGFFPLRSLPFVSFQSKPPSRHRMCLYPHKGVPAMSPSKLIPRKSPPRWTCMLWSPLEILLVSNLEQTLACAVPSLCAAGRSRSMRVCVCT